MGPVRVAHINDNRDVRVAMIDKPRELVLIRGRTPASNHPALSGFKPPDATEVRPVLRAERGAGDEEEVQDGYCYAPVHSMTPRRISMIQRWPDYRQLTSPVC